MAKKKKKNLTLLLLVLVMIVMAGAYITLTKLNDAKEAKKIAEAEATSVSTIDTSKAIKITFTNQSGTMTLIKDNDTWNNQADAAFPVNQTYVTSMLASMADIKVTQTVVETPEDLGQYGLDQPTLIAEVTIEDGSSEKIAIGIEIPVAGGYYAQVGSGAIVYAVDTSIFDSFNYSQTQMIEMEATPTITTANITHLTVNAGENGSNFEAVYDTDGTGDSDYFLWDIKQPYRTPVSGNPTLISTLLENYASFTYNECVDYNCEDPSTYGIIENGKAINIAYYEEEAITSDPTSTDDSTNETQDSEETKKVGKSFGLNIGNLNENGDYYVQPVGSRAVYLMSASSVETMMNINAFDYVNKNIFLENIDEVKSIDFTVEGVLHTVTVTKSKSDEEDATDTYQKDGSTMEAEDFQTAYANLVGIILSGESKEQVTDNTPYLTVTVHATSDKTVKFLPYDGANFYQVAMDGEMNYLVDKRSVEDMLSSFLEVKK